MRLVERDRETATLAQLHKECATGHSQIAVINGALGSGKSTLLHKLTDEAASSGALVLEATASNSEYLLPLGVVDQAFRFLSSSGHPAEPQAGSLINDVHKAIAEARRPENISRLIPSAINQMHRALYEVARCQPVVLCVDDAHFIDTASLEYLLALMPV